MMNEVREVREVREVELSEAVDKLITERQEAVEMVQEWQEHFTWCETQIINHMEQFDVGQATNHVVQFEDSFEIDIEKLRTYYPSVFSDVAKTIKKLKIE